MPSSALADLRSTTTTDPDGHPAVEVSLTVSSTAEDVFRVLQDGWLYALWVVGASHIRAVDETWPAPGSRIHHSVGPWPLTLDDATEVLRVDPPWSLELRAKAWPVGTAWIRLTTHPAPEGRTEICLAERADGGPGRHLPLAAQRVALAPRNNESLRRLAHLVEGRHG